MDIRGKGVEFAVIARIIEKVSADKYDGNIVMHQDAKPLREDGYDLEPFTTPWGYTYNRRVNVRGYGFRGRIIGAVSKGPGTRRSWSGRNGPWACWHAYRDVLRAILTEYPHATVKTSLAVYRGLSGFESVYPGTADHNIGSMFAPAYMPDLCDCEDYE